MSLQTQIETKIKSNLDLSYAEVVNESHMHNVPAGSESHFKLVLVSNDFEEKGLVVRHKMIYKILDEEMKAGIHALALHTLTVPEWEKKHGNVPDSPLCHGGSK